jgi:hypothetical protein
METPLPAVASLGPDVHQYVFDWSPSEYTRAVRSIGKHRSSHSIFTWGIWAAIAAVVAMSLLPSGSLGFALLMVTIVLLTVTYTDWVAPWLQARRYQREDPCASAPITHLISAERLGIRTHSASIDLQWSHIRRIVETEEFFLFYYDRNSACFTPKRAVPPQDLPGLRATIQSAAGSKATLQGAR